MGIEISNKRRLLVFKKTDFHCAYCGKSLKERCSGNANVWFTSDEATIDHIVSRSNGGGNNIENLLPCCRGCNLSKGKKSLEEFRWWKTFKVCNTPMFSTEQLLYLSTKAKLSDLFPPLVKFYFETMKILPSVEGMVVREWR